LRSLVGTLLSGLLYLWGDLTAAPWGSTEFVVLTWTFALATIWWYLALPWLEALLPSRVFPPLHINMGRRCAVAICSWCDQEMLTAESCVVAVVHIAGRPVDMIPYGSEPGLRRGVAPCGDCGVRRGHWHHPGCDLQRCPVCHRQLMSCGCHFDEDGEDSEVDDVRDDEWFDSSLEPFGVDAAGLPTAKTSLHGGEVVVHFGEYPSGDITTVDGLRCTTALRTCIDLATEVTPDLIRRMIADCLSRGLFSIDDAKQRLVDPDMARHPGAELVRRAIAGL
jgi:hypothetical protein